MSESLKAVVALLIISLGGGGAVVFFHSFFSPAIEARRGGEEREAVEKMFAPGVNVTKINGKKNLPDIYWVGKKDSIVTGYVFPLEARALSGSIVFLVALDSTGAISGVKIIEERRMQGQGPSLKDRFPTNTIWGRLFGKKETENQWFFEQFIGTSANKPFIIDTGTQGKTIMDVGAEKERREENRICAVTGATKSTRAIVKAIEKSAASFVLAIKRQEQ